MKQEEKTGSTVVSYTRKTFDNETTIVVDVPLSNYKVPSRESEERKGREIYGFLQEDFKEVPFPKTEPTRTEERGGDWTSHYIQYWD